MGTRRTHAIFIVTISPVLGFLLNTVRVLMIILNPLSGVTADHTILGIVVLVAGVVAYSGIESLLNRFFPSGSPRVGGAAYPPNPDELRLAHYDPRLSAGVIVALVVALASVALPTWSDGGKVPGWSISMPVQTRGWKARKMETDRLFLGSVHFSRTVGRRYENAGEVVEVFMGMSDRLKRDRSLFSPKNALPGPGWRIVEERKRSVDWAPVR